MEFYPREDVFKLVDHFHVTTYPFMRIDIWQAKRCNYTIELRDFIIQKEQHITLILKYRGIILGCGQSRTEHEAIIDLITHSKAFPHGLFFSYSW